MVDITPLIKTGSRVIQSYGAGGVRVSGTVYPHSVCVMADSVKPWSGDLADISFDCPDDQIELVLVGLSHLGGPIAPDIREALRARGWSVEIMTLGAACRTYNVLMAEGRKVGVSLQV